MLSARGIGVAWATYDHAEARLEYQPADPLDPVFYLRRPRAKAVYAWRLFRSRQEAVQYAMEMLKGDEDAARWADAGPAHDFDDLVRRFGLSPGA